MNLAQLKLELDRLEIDPDSYSFGRSLPEEQYVIDEESPGHWVTYYAQRGEHAGKEEFFCEAEACRRLLERLKREVGVGSAKK